MTRFARSRGSKASNERAPEDGTPWEVMKEQLLQAKKDNEESRNREEAEQKRIENYENFLKERKVQKRKATWCDFPETEKHNNITSNNNETQPKTKKKNKRKKAEAPIPNNEVNMNIDINDEGNAKISKKKKKKSLTETEPLNTQPLIDVDNNASSEIKNCNEGDIDKSKSKKKKPPTTAEPLNNTQTTNVAGSIQSKKNKKKDQKSQSNEALQNPQSTEVNREENQKTNKMKQENEKMTKQKASKRKKNKNLIDGKPVRRKEINDRSFQLIINGKEIELVRFDGFPVMKKDADRLEELKSSMIKKGIPKSEVQRTMKLERRRAEKALARVKRDVCYNCRKGGHVLSDCPELKSKIPGANGADGVCFKCGSTEHRQFECKVQKDKEFRFATCFICKEPGHIARQCPDNPKGLYPNGGNCKLCGDVTHLRKDCPTVMDKKEGSTIKLQTLDSGENIEDVGQQSNKVTPTETSKKPKKIRF